MKKLNELLVIVEDVESFDKSRRYILPVMRMQDELQDSK
jgi:hypothetical protein